MTRRRVFWVSQFGGRFVTPEFNGDAEEFAKLSSKYAGSCDSSWNEILALFAKCKDYSDFVKASIEAQACYHSRYYDEELKTIRPVHQLRQNEECPVCDSEFWFYEVPSNSEFEAAHKTEANPDDVKALIAKGDSNSFLRFGGFYHDDPFLDLESSFCFKEVDDLTALAQIFYHGNWAYRTGFIYKGAAFINQLDGGGEWWTLVKDKDGNWQGIDSVSFRALVKDGTFVSYIKQLLEKDI